MPRMLTPAIKRSDALAAERSRTVPLDYWPDASFAEARRLAAHDAQIDESRFIGERRSALGNVWWHGDGDPDGLADEGERAEAAALWR
jgi:hypothetical protein